MKNIDLSSKLNILRYLFLNGIPIILYVLAGMPSIFNGKISSSYYIYDLSWSVGIIFLEIYCLRNVLRIISDLITNNTESLKGKISGLKYVVSRFPFPVIYFQIGNRKFKYLDLGNSKNYRFLTKHRGSWKIKYYSRSGIPIILSPVK